MSVRPKIAFACHPYHRGGVTRWMADAALAFDATGYEVYFITVEPARPFHLSAGRDTLVQMLARTTNTVRVISQQVGREFEFGTPAYRALVYGILLRKLPIGIPVILSDAEAIWDAAAALSKTYPVLGVLHADEQHYYQLARKYADRVDALVCVSERIRNKIAGMIPSFDKERITTIPCGINLPAYTENSRDGNVLQLIYVGRITEFQKRTSDLAKIAAALQEQQIAFQLSIVGDGDDRLTLEQQFKSAGLGDYVQFTGWLSQKAVNSKLAESDILLLTSEFEGMPIAAMEALAAGCAVAATRVSGIEDYETDPVAADCLAVFEVGAIDDAVAKITSLSARPAHLVRNAARKFAEKEFGMDICLARYAAMIKSLPPHGEAAPDQRFPVWKRYASYAISVARSLRVKLSR